ncbi:hypothetical protein C8T65DRAFT_703032 [Cerioporus squamosus]|nr:hypothetical protein C8T65DRAFT_703032 [Cerioporus squamosus]
MAAPRRSRRKRSPSPADSSDGLPDILTIVKTIKKAWKSTAPEEQPSPEAIQKAPNVSGSGNQDSQASDIQASPANAEAPKRYQTRNCDRRPGVEAGLAPRRRKEVQATAQAKRDQAAAEVAAREAQKTAREAEKTEHIGQLAKIMDRQAREEIMDAMAFDEHPNSGELHSHDELDDEPQSLPRTPKPSARTGKMQRHTAQDEDDDENETPVPSKRGKASALRKQQVANVDSDNDEREDAPPKKTALTQKEKHVHRQEMVLSDLQGLRTVIARGANASDTTGALPRPVGGPKSGQAKPFEAFNTNWRRQLLEHTKTPVPKKKGTQPVRLLDAGAANPVGRNAPHIQYEHQLIDDC